MRVELPRPKRALNGNTVVARYEAATAGSTCVKTSAFGGDSVAFTLPRLWQPSRRGMMPGYGSTGELDILEFDTNPNVRGQVLDACRNIYLTHPVVKACVNVYSRYPVRGIRLEHKDPEMQRFYEELFLEDLGFKDFLIDVGKTFWVDGMAFVYGNWSDGLGQWVGEEILDAKDMTVVRVPFVGHDYVYMTPSQELKDIVRDVNPESARLRRDMPELCDAVMKGQDIPISSDRLTVIANRDKPSDLYGTPVILAAWNALRLESRMNSAMMATADRLYAPLLLFTVGGTLPTGQQYIPSAQALDQFRANLDAALASDFRAIVTHSGVSVQEAIKQTNMSVFKQDMELYDERVFMAFGLSSSILKPNQQNYATSALEFQMAAQIMASYQDKLVEIYDHQAAMVAEAQRHYEKDGAGNVVTEYREMWDDEQGDYVVKQVPKLDYPKLKFEVINFKDEQKEREFRMKLRDAGVPIADEDIAIGVDIDLGESAERYSRERISNGISESRRNMAMMQSAMKQDIPVPPSVCQYLAASIPPDGVQQIIDRHREDIETGAGMPGADVEIGDGPSDMPEPAGGETPGEGETGVRQRPEESDEQRGDMPVAAGLRG